MAVLLMPGRGKGDPACWFPSGHRGHALRHAQHVRHQNARGRLELARLLVAAKIAQQQLWLEERGLNIPLQRFVDALPEARDIASLMGYEGAASARYFAAWGTLWREPWRFDGRNRRPPQDPVNALLSLAYSLATQHVGQGLARYGLDVALGFLHDPRSNRPALALDLLEPLRPWIDEWVLRLLEAGHLQPGHFTYSAGEGCRLDAEGRAIFYRY